MKTAELTHIYKYITTPTILDLGGFGVALLKMEYRWLPGSMATTINRPRYLKAVYDRSWCAPWEQITMIQLDCTFNLQLKPLSTTLQVHEERFEFKVRGTGEVE